MSALADLFSSRVRAETYRQLFGAPGEEVHVRELARRSGCAFSAVQRELRLLLRHGIVVQRKDGNRTYYRANAEHPFFPELRSLVRKSSGLGNVLREALADDRVRVAFVFGSLAAGTEKPGSDVDVMVIGEISPREVHRRLSGLTEQLGREVNPHVFGTKEFVRRRTASDHFLTTVLREPKQFLIGNEDELGRLA